MHQEQQGRRALFSFIRCAFRVKLLALALLCLAFVPPAQAAHKTAKKAAVAATTPKTSAISIAGPGEAFAKEVITRNAPSQEAAYNFLMPLTGTWDFEEFLWTDSKPDKPQSSLGVVINGMFLDDHYLVSKIQGSLNIAGQVVPMEGQELIGYDTVKKAYVFSLADTVTTGLTIGQGSYDAKKRVLTEKGNFINPLTGAAQAFRAEFAFIDDNHYTRTVFAAGKAGRETKLIEIDYTRRN